MDVDLCTHEKGCANRFVAILFFLKIYINLYFLVYFQAFIISLSTVSTLNSCTINTEIHPMYHK